APSTTTSLPATPALSSAASIFWLCSIGTNSSLSPWIISAGAVLLLTCKSGEQSTSFLASNVKGGFSPGYFLITAGGSVVQPRRSVGGNSATAHAIRLLCCKTGSVALESP